MPALSAWFVEVGKRDLTTSSRPANVARIALEYNAAVARLPAVQ
jgi:hypothetical protein